MSANQRYKIKLNKEKPTVQEVNQHKNFKRVLSQYRRSSKREPLHAQLLKLNKLLPTLFIMVFVIIIVFYYDSTRRDKPVNKAPIEQNDSTKVKPTPPLIKTDSTNNKD